MSNRDNREATWFSHDMDESCGAPVKAAPAGPALNLRSWARLWIKGTETVYLKTKKKTSTIDVASLTRLHVRWFQPITNYTVISQL